MPFPNAFRMSAYTLILLLSAAMFATPASETPLRSVIVQSQISATHATAAVIEAGGVVRDTIHLIDSVVAEVPADEVVALQAAGLQVTTDHAVSALGRPSKNDAVDSAFTLRDTIQVTGADTYWSHGATGAGVGVALIDTGVATVAGLDDGQVFHGPDLSFEASSDNLRHQDTYGHGTHMAGLIVGRDQGASTETFDTRPDDFLGIAPDAHLISIKVADSSGATDVSQVLAAIDWVVTHRNDPGMNIRVLNLSFGTYPNMGYETDPLAHAAEAAWNHGIVVVAAAGNDGDTRIGLTSPAHNPRLLAVGSVDTNGSTQYSHWEPLAFSARGDGDRNPDIMAPGSSLLSLRVPGSALDLAHGHNAVVDERFFKGSGTSQSAAIVSGAAALILSANPTWTPDDVKEVIVGESSGLRPGAGFNHETGKWALNLDQMHSAWPHAIGHTSAPSVGGGSLDDARGDVVLVTADGVELRGEVDIFGAPLDTAALADGISAGGTWQGGTWNGTQWSGTQWSGTQWSGTQWSGTDWAGTQWSGTQWSGNQWSGTQWSGTQWSGTQWSGTQWSGTQWSGTQWSGAAWLSAGWE